MDEAYHPGLEGVLAAETEISYLDVEQESILIRGYDLIELANHVTYLDVAYLLWHGDLPSEGERATLEQELAATQMLPNGILTILKALGPEVHTMDALRTGISALSAFDVEGGGGSGVEAADRQLISLWAKMPALLGESYRIKHALAPMQAGQGASYVERLLWQVTGRPPSALEIDVFDKLLTLYSEHEMPNSTFSARVIASTLSDVYGVLVGAAASLKGPLHGGANEAVMRMLLEEVVNPNAMAPYLKAKLQAKARIMGFGHRVYMHRPDPRAMMMKRLLGELVEAKGASVSKAHDLVAMCQIGEDVMRQEKGLFANLDYYAAPVYYLLGVPTELFTPIFFAARMAGLSAHIREQYGNNRLYRPRVRYVGARGRTLPPRE